MTDTIFAVSSGAPPAAIAVMRISGPSAFAAGAALAGNLPPPRVARLRRLANPAGIALDQALVLVFPGPATATGEDLLELHLHGGRAIVRAVEAVLAAHPGLRPAEPGEFTRRALANGRIDLAQAEGLADLLAAETETARRAALAASEGALSRAVAAWRSQLMQLSAQAEALIDFADEDDVPAAPAAVSALVGEIRLLAAELHEAASQPPVDRLRDGVRVVLAGPPNSGKSTLINALVGREVAIATPEAGTTRDVIEAPVVRDGIAYVLTDVAGIREVEADSIEAIGIERARQTMADADVVLWLGDCVPPKPDMWAIHPRADAPGRSAGMDRLAVSAKTGAGLQTLWDGLAERARDVLPAPDSLAFNRRQLEKLRLASSLLSNSDPDLLLIAERLRLARRALGTINGTEDVEGMLDALFGRFCIGK